MTTIMLACATIIVVLFTLAFVVSFVGGVATTIF